MSVEQVSNLLLQWEDANNDGREVTNILIQLSELFEVETEAFLKKDPDPFDDRHPSRLQPDCTLGHMLKTVFRSELIIDEIVKVYCQRDNVELNTACCRLLLDLLPGLESVIFEEEGFVPRLFEWAEKAGNPLRSYATGLLAAAMDVQEIAANYKDKNAYFVPLMLRRLQELSSKYLLDPASSADHVVPPRPFSGLSKKNSEKRLPPSDDDRNNYKSPKKRKRNDFGRALRYSPILPEVKSGTPNSNSKISPVKQSLFEDTSNSSWNLFEQYMIGSYQVYPLTLAAEQRYIFQYLTPMGEYQDLIGHIFEANVLHLILPYLDIHRNPDVRLTFEALKYLAALLCHKKIAIEFLHYGGLQLLLRIPYPSIAATGVSICLYYLSYTEEIMEKICLMSPSNIADLVSYALWLLECSHDSSRCHATMFFCFAFPFKVILEHFDEQDGLRKLFNVMSTLEVFVLRNSRTLSDDQVFANRQTTRHVCGALKRYFEAHLANKILSLSPPSSQHKSSYKAFNLSYESIEGYINSWHDLLTPMVEWKPVNEFINLEGVTFLLELISNYYELSYSGRAETVRNALDILKVCSLTSATQVIFCEKINSREFASNTGITNRVLLTAAEGQDLPVADIQRSALQIIINCVCTKIQVENPRITANPKKKTISSVEELLSKLCENVRIKNGIMCLINLLSTKTPLTDADSIRALACKALCGLARLETVKQIISKLPLVTDGELLNLMKEPVLQDKGNYHVLFCKFGLELIERVTGAPVSDGPERSMLNISKSEIVAKSKVVYNEAQLMQLICDHLSQKGFTETVACLQKEMNDKGLSLPVWMQPVSLLKSPIARPGMKRSFRNNEIHTNSTPRASTSISASPSSSSASSIPPPFVPLRIVVTKKTERMTPECKASPSSRLQKPQDCSGSYCQTPAMKKQSVSNFSYYDSQPGISLDSIVTEYLRKQHALCKNPMLACPPFDLFTPHKCPEPHRKSHAPVNCALRIQKKQTYHRDGGCFGAALDRKFIFSKFRPVHSFRDSEGRFDFSCCSFFNYNPDHHPRILIGTEGHFGSNVGELKVYNVNSLEEEMSKNSHARGLSHIQSSNVAPLIITSDGGRIGNSSLWKLEEDLEIVRQFSEVSHLEFAKRTVEKTVGTKHDCAVIIDTNTGSEIQKFLTGDLGNNYVGNRATFDYRDEFVLSDGLLWDVRSGKMVHKLDKFGAKTNGVFHPNGREIISNTEIWDLRTFKLLRTVQLLDQCSVSFNSSGTVIYGVFLNRNVQDERINCFYSFDAYDYSSIATVDVKRPVFELAADFNDHYIAGIESQTSGGPDPYRPPLLGIDCICRLYEIGRSSTKEDGDECGEESDTEEETDDDEEVDEVDIDEDNEDRDDDVIFELDEDDGDDNDDADSSGSSDESEALFSLNTSIDV